MSGKFEYKKFSDICINDTFFDELKEDYPGTKNTTGFIEWFNKKVEQDKEALVYIDDNNSVEAFMYLKEEDGEEIVLTNKTLPDIPRIKIGTLRIAESSRGQRLGEGAIGLALWKWRDSKREEIYVTVFPEHCDLITQLERFGFVCQGYNLDGEGVYLKNRNNINFENPYKSFPFINSHFKKGGFLIIEDGYHDTLFPLSKLKNISQKTVELSVANGFSKYYIGSAVRPHYKVGEPIFIYRKFVGSNPGFKSCFTSICVATEVVKVKEFGQELMTCEELIKRIGNKSVFDEEEIREKYNKEKTVTVIGLLYYGFFGEGRNINWNWLNKNGYWKKNGVNYPTETQYTFDDVTKILQEAKVDVQNIIVDKSGTC